MSWHKVHRRDDWGSITIHAGNSPKTHAGNALATGLRPGITYLIRWPDGTTSHVPTRGKTILTSISEQGRGTEVITSLVPVGVVVMHGFEVEIPLDGLDVWVDDEPASKTKALPPGHKVIGTRADGVTPLVVDEKGIPEECGKCGRRYCDH